MLKRFVATGIESSVCKSWGGWEGEIEWLYFYNVELLPEIKAQCIEAGMAPDATADVEISMNKLEGRVVTVTDEGEEVFELPFTLKVTPSFD
uniref:Phage protein n=1 Tax=Phage MSP1 TaxID=2801538 RepID=A0AB37G6S5_9VIRU